MCVRGGSKVFGYIKRTTSCEIEKKKSLHVAPWAPHTCNVVVLKPTLQKILLVVLEIGKLEIGISKNLSAHLRISDGAVLPVVPGGVYKVSINRIIKSKNRLINHAHVTLCRRVGAVEVNHHTFLTSIIGVG
jgi:hypothetical protein